jgi:putative beta-barrel porin BBP2
MSKHNRSAVTRHLPRTALCCALLALLPQAADAVELDYQIGMRLLHSDNISLVEDDKIDETVLSPQLSFTLTHNGPSLQASVRGDVQYLDYLDNTYDNDTRGQFDGQLDWMLIPDRLSLMAADTLSQQSVSTLSSFSPGNQQQINVFVAGPSFYARFGETTRGQLDVRYTNSYAEETAGFNNDRYNVAARLRRQLNETDQLLFNVESTKVEFDTLSELYNYRREDAYVTYRSQLSRVQLNVDAGYTRLKPEDIGEAESSSLLRASANWQITASSLLSASFRNEFADATQDLVVRIGTPEAPGTPGEPPVGNPDDPNLIVIPDTYKQKQLTVSYEYSGQRLRTELAPYYHQLRYLRDPTFDADSYGVRFNGSYELRPQTFFTFVARREARDFDNLAREDRDTTLGVGLDKRFSRHWGGALEYRHRKRDSSLAGQNYVENMVQVSFTYFR